MTAPDAGPLFSVVTPVYAPPVEILRSTLASVLAQTHQDWELVLVDDASPDPAVLSLLRETAASDPRVRLIERATNGHIVAASNDGLSAARGEFIALLDHDDLLLPEALEVMADRIERHPTVDYLYSDEAVVGRHGAVRGVFHKPDWSPERLRGQMYTCHLSVLRTSLVREVGGFHEGFDGSQDHDLVLRVTERARRILHVPEVLYHWRAVPGSAADDPEAKPYAWHAGLRAVQAQLDRLAIRGEAELGPKSGCYRVRRWLDPHLLVSVVIPTRGDSGLVWGRERCFVVEAVRSLVERGGHEHLEIVVVHDPQTPSEALAELRRIAGDRLVLVGYDRPFNFSEKCNLGVVASYGDVVVLLNDDVEIKSEDFVTKLVAPLQDDGVAMTGAKLLFADTTLQHAGLALFREGPGHMFHGSASDWAGPSSALLLSRECSGLTAACVALWRTTYDAVGGLTEVLPRSYNDVDLSHKIARHGRLLWIEPAQAYHFESKSRDPKVEPWERELLFSRWDPPVQDRYMPRFGMPGNNRSGVPEPAEVSSPPGTPG